MVNSLHDPENITVNTPLKNCCDELTVWRVEWLPKITSSYAHRPASRHRKRLRLAYEFLWLASRLAAIYTAAAADGCLRWLSCLVHCKLILQLCQLLLRDVLKLHWVLYPYFEKVSWRYKNKISRKSVLKIQDKIVSSRYFFKIFLCL